MEISEMKNIIVLKNFMARINCRMDRIRGSTNDLAYINISKIY